MKAAPNVKYVLLPMNALALQEMYVPCPESQVYVCEYF